MKALIYWRCDTCNESGTAFNQTEEEVEVEHAIATGCKGHVLEVPPPPHALATCKQCGKLLTSWDFSVAALQRKMVFTFVCSCRLTEGREAYAIVAEERLQASVDRVAVFNFVFGLHPPELVNRRY